MYAASLWISACVSNFVETHFKRAYQPRLQAERVDHLTSSPSSSDKAFRMIHLVLVRRVI